MTVEATPVETPVADPSAPPVEIVSDASQGDPIAEAPAASAEPVSDADENETPPEGGARKSRAQERIEELAQTNKYLREHNEFLREHLAKATPPAAKPTPSVDPPPAPADEPMPTLESCGYDSAAHATEVAKWVKKQVKAGVQAEIIQAKVHEETQSQESVLVEAANEFRKDHPDFDVLIQNPKLRWSPTVLGALNEAGSDSPALGYFLANNPDKLAKISAMKPTQAAMALGRIQEDLTRKKETPPAPKPPAPPGKTPTPAPAKKPANTNAPPPPTPVSGAASPDIDPMTLSGTEWVALRRQELAERRKGQTRTVRSY